MIKKSFLPIIALLLVLLLSGCFQPIKQGQATISYTINNDGGILASTKLSGIKGTDFGAWQNDCKKQIKETINEVIASYQDSLTQAGTDTDKLGFASVINVLTNVKTRINCSVTETDANNATATYSYNLSYEELQQLSNAPQQTNALSISKTSGIISLNLPIFEETIQQFTETNIQIKEIRIKAQGNIESIEPAGFTKQGEEMVLTHDTNSEIGLIKLKINTTGNTTPAPNPNTTNNQPSEQNNFLSSKIFGFDLIILIAIIFAVIVIVGLIIFFLRKSRETKPFKPPKQARFEAKPETPLTIKPEKESIISRAMEKGLQASQHKQQEESIEEFTVKTEEIEPKPKKETKEKTLEEELEIEQKPEQKTTEMQEEKDTIQESEETQSIDSNEDEDSEDYGIKNPAKEIFSIEEQQDIEKLTKALLPKASDFTADDIRDAILNQGFSERIAKEVLRKLGF